MRKQSFLLYTTMAYVLGIIIGLLINNLNVLFILVIIPTGYVLLRGAKNEDKWNE